MDHNLEDMLRELEGMPNDSRAMISRHDDVYTFEPIVIESEGHIPFVELSMVQSDIDYGIITVPREMNGFFPGYKNQFVLETSVKPFVMHLTSASSGTGNGEEKGGYLGHPRPANIQGRFLRLVPDAGNRIKGSFLRWYDDNSDISVGDTVKIYRRSSELYSLER